MHTLRCMDTLYMVIEKDKVKRKMYITYGSFSPFIRKITCEMKKKFQCFNHLLNNENTFNMKV